MCKLLVLTALLCAAPVMAQDGSYIRYWPPVIPVTSSGSSFFASGIGLGGTVASPYANLYGDAANTLALRNGGTTGTPVPQTFNVYNFCDGAACATGYERLALSFAGGAFTINSQAAGTGAVSAISINPNGGSLYIGAEVYPTGTRSIGGAGVPWQSGFFLRSIQGSKSKALTESSATAAWDCALAAGAHTGGKLNYCVYAADATDQQERCADIRVSAVNKAGTTTCGIVTVTGNATVNETTDANAPAISAGTLTYAVTCADTTDSFSVSFNAVSSLTQTTLQSESRWDIMNPATCTPQ